MMAATAHDPQLLFSLNHVKAYLIQNGREQDITPSGSQTLSLLMVSTTSQNSLHLRLPPELDLPLPATTQVYPRRPRSYLIPRTDTSGTFTRIELPEKVKQEDVETFESILAQCTAFMSQAPPPTGSAQNKPYNPADWQAGGRLGGGKTQPGHVCLVDEDNGDVVGELAGGAKVYEDAALSHGSQTGNQDPVEIEISADGTRVDVRPVSEEYLRMARDPRYKDSSLVQNAAAASRFIVTGSTKLGNLLTKQAEEYTQRTAPTNKPVKFSPAAQTTAKHIHAVTKTTAGVTAKTVDTLSNFTQNLTARLAGREEIKAETGKPPGLLNKSMIAFTTLMDGVAQGGSGLLADASNSATVAVNHAYGPEAGKFAATIGGGLKNVGLVYVDVTGVTRKAIIKSVAKGMIVGKVKDKNGVVQDVIVGAGDGGEVPEKIRQQAEKEETIFDAGKRRDSGEWSFEIPSLVGKNSPFNQGGSKPPPPPGYSSSGYSSGYSNEKAKYQ